MTKIESQLKSAFAGFAKQLNTEPKDEVVYARENELVSLFAFGALAATVRPGLQLHSLLQIGIEVAVRQKRGRVGAKKAVRKDLVIWTAPGKTLWNSDGDIENKPLAIVEWKGGTGKSRKGAARRERPHDLAYLAWAAKSGVEGYSVVAERIDKVWSINVTRIVKGKPPR